MYLIDKCISKRHKSFQSERKSSRQNLQLHLLKLALFVTTRGIHSWCQHVLLFHELSCFCKMENGRFWLLLISKHQQKSFSAVFFALKYWTNLSRRCFFPKQVQVLKSVQLRKDERNVFPVCKEKGRRDIKFWIQQGIHSSRIMNEFFRTCWGENCLLKHSSKKKI